MRVTARSLQEMRYATMRFGSIGGCNGHLAAGAVPSVMSRKKQASSIADTDIVCKRSKILATIQNVRATIRLPRQDLALSLTRREATG